MSLGVLIREEHPSYCENSLQFGGRAPAFEFSNEGGRLTDEVSLLRGKCRILLRGCGLRELVGADNTQRQFIDFLDALYRVLYGPNGPG